MTYFIQANVYAMLMYCIYFLFLKDTLRHGFNRVYLLLCAMLPLIIPFVKVSAFGHLISADNSVSGIILPTAVVNGHTAGNMYSTPSWQAILIISYILVALVLFVRLLVQLVKVRLFINRHTKLQPNTTLIRNSGIGPGSWGKYIFLPGNDVDKSVLAHEQAHIQLRHSSDLFFIRLLQCFFWPNLMLIPILKELKIVHEFQADACSVSDKEQYVAAMLSQVFSTKAFPLSHTFFHHPVKRRIMMLQKSGTSRLVYFIAPVLCITMFSTIVVAQSAKDSPAQGKKDEIYTFTKKMPSAPYDIGTFLQQNLKYPDSARSKNIQGRVVTRFVVNEDGDIVGATVMKSPDPLLSKAALEVLAKMPKWTPGELDGKKVKVYYTLPISFNLSK